MNNETREALEIAAVALILFVLLALVTITMDRYDVQTHIAPIWR